MDSHEQEALRLRNESVDRERGNFGLKTPRPRSVDEMLPPTEMESEQYMHFFQPEADYQIANPGSNLNGLSLLEDLAENLPPFIEDMPLGKMQKWRMRPAKAVTQSGNVRQIEMLQLRTENDARIKQILGEH